MRVFHSIKQINYATLQWTQAERKPASFRDMTLALDHLKHYFMGHMDLYSLADSVAACNMAMDVMTAMDEYILGDGHCKGFVVVINFDSKKGNSISDANDLLIEVLRLMGSSGYMDLIS